MTIDYITNQEQSLPDLDSFYTIQFWNAVQEAELKSGLATLPGGKNKIGLCVYPDDIFQVSMPKQCQRYDIYIAEVRKAVEEIIQHTGTRLSPHVASAVLNHFNVLFSRHIYNIPMVLMTTGLIAKFEDLTAKYEMCFQEYDLTPIFIPNISPAFVNRGHNYVHEHYTI
ncbi:uncharacterized protein EI90DRAFT_3130599 [Cantharellus anzutake]|uniref:uncharacterized protein n=1 Tax=Cantharellus anzutake TaxID=1750568 RepID=UPI0019034102|nr:uncharacterized protein EI90DRAFT_3130599 [Cantharellus anzutake]KAF8322953.1 hypothetical protein EI90DRAFT_3130599 [Cantharellus anzutake]